MDGRANGRVEQPAPAGRTARTLQLILDRVFHLGKVQLDPCDLQRPLEFSQRIRQMSHPHW